MKLQNHHFNSLVLLSEENFIINSTIDFCNGGIYQHSAIMYYPFIS